MKNVSPRASLYLITGLVLLVVVTLVTAYANSPNTIRGCYKREGGQLRIVSALSECNPSEQSISWHSGDSVAINNHHQEVDFSLLLGESKAIPLPAKDLPVRIDYSMTNLFDESTGAPVAPFVFSQTVFYDSATGQKNIAFPAISLASSGCDANANIGMDADGNLVVYTGAGSCSSTILAKVHLNMWY